ncbi:hypothetical protein Tco_0051539 [Tanacetum coccineum]
MTVGEVNTRVIELAELHERDTQDLYALLEDAQDRDVWMVEERPYVPARLGLCSIGLSQRLIQELQTHRNHVYAHEPIYRHTRQATAGRVLSFRNSTGTRDSLSVEHVVSNIRETDCRRQDQMVEALRVIRDMRQIMHLHTREDKSHVHTSTQTTDPRIYPSIDRDKALLRNPQKRMEVTVHTRCMVSKNLRSRGICPDWEVLKKKMRDKYCPQGENQEVESSCGNLSHGNNVPHTMNVSKGVNLILPSLLPMKPRRLTSTSVDFLTTFTGLSNRQDPKTLDETIGCAMT